MRILMSVETDLANAVQDALEEAGHEVTVNTDPVEAVGQFITTPFEMFMCDLREDDDTGIEVAGTMKRMDGGTHLRVVFFAKDRAQSDVIQDKCEGAFEVSAVLREPIGTEEIKRVVEKAAPPKKRAIPAGDRKKPVSQKEKTRRMIVKLRKERERVQDAPSHSVLRLDEEPDRPEIEEARRRLKRRYMKVVKTESLPREARQMAAELAQLVDHAYIELCAAGRPTAKRRVVTDEERIDKYLEHARELIEGRDWDKCDKLLSMARLIRQDHPKILALQGWARYNNADLDKEKREEHAKDLMMMAEQFDPNDFEGQFYLAQFFQDKGDLPGAWRRIVRATRADGEHQAAKALFDKIKRAGGKNLKPEDQVI